MREFDCPVCGTYLTFESLSCTCGSQVRFDDVAADFVAGGTSCANTEQIGCNWLPSGGFDLCRSCRMTTVTPETRTGDNRLLWAETERAKRWVLHCLSRWGWFGAEDFGPAPEFHMLSEVVEAGYANVTMGHTDGVLTINVSEADAATRIFRQGLLGERFRTVIGHMRHEISHFLFRRLAAQHDDFLAEFRALFGDERKGYREALQHYYASGPSSDWSETHVTQYASSHPHEDWAESAAHIQHIADIADSFVAAGLSAPALRGAPLDSYAATSEDRLISVGMEIGIALNHVNRSMGLPDLYPFVLTPIIRKKLAFAHRWLRR